MNLDKDSLVDALPEVKAVYDMLTGPGSLQEALNKEDDLGAFIRAHLHFESAIDEFFQRALASASAISWTRYGFGFKIELLEALGIFAPENIRILRAINGVRNRFAHSLQYRVTNSDSDVLFNCLPPTGVEAVEKACQGNPPEYAFAMRWRAIVVALYITVQSHLDRVVLPLGPLTDVSRSYQTGFWKFVPPGLEEWLREQGAAEKTVEGGQRP